MAQEAAVIVDIVGSRNLQDRDAAQQAVYDAFRRADAHVTPSTALWATAGDEFQVIYPSVASAAVATSLVSIALTSPADCRFGIGKGDVRIVETTVRGHPIQDGTAWYRAREAVETAHRLQSRGHPDARSWFVGSADAEEGLVRAFLAIRDHTIARMSERQRRQAALFLAGVPQVEIARMEKVSQSAVSQSLQRSGATSLLLAIDHLVPEKGLASS